MIPLHEDVRFLAAQARVPALLWMPRDIRSRNRTSTALPVPKDMLDEGHSE